MENQPHQLVRSPNLETTMYYSKMLATAYQEGRASYVIWDQGIAFFVIVGGNGTTDDEVLVLKNWTAIPHNTHP